MKRIVVTSDWHLDAVTAGVRRFEEIASAANTTATKAIESRADAYFFLGDLCDPDAGSCVFRCVEVALKIAERLAKAKIPSYWLAGNHDVIEDGSGDTTLSPIRSLSSDYVTVVEQPSTFGMVFGVDFGMNLVVLPYVATSRRYDPAAFVRDSFEKRRDDFARHPIVVAGHLNVEGIVPGSETEDMPRGRDVWFPYEEVCRQIDDSGVKRAVLLNGHYHKAGAYAVGGKGSRAVHVPGSLARLTFGEEDYTPSFLTLEIPDGK